MRLWDGGHLPICKTSNQPIEHFSYLDHAFRKGLVVPLGDCLEITSGERVILKLCCRIERDTEKAIGLPDTLVSSTFHNVGRD